MISKPMMLHIWDISTVSSRKFKCQVGPTDRGGCIIVLYRHSLSVTPETVICHFVPFSVCVSVCPAIKAYISVPMSWILMKLGVSVGT